MDKGKRTKSLHIQQKIEQRESNKNIDWS
jgi:hypothetical protein